MTLMSEVEGESAGEWECGPPPREPVNNHAMRAQGEEACNSTTLMPAPEPSRVAGAAAARRATQAVV